MDDDAKYWVATLIIIAAIANGLLHGLMRL